MKTLLKPCLAIYWLSLAAWFAALVTAAVSAAQVFGTLPGMSMTLDRFAAYASEEHGRLAAGLVMAEIFFTVDVVQMVAVPVTLVTLGLQLTVLGLPWQRPANLFRASCIVLATGLFAWYAVVLAPDLNRTLRLHWEAAAAGDPAQAMMLQKQFTVQHGVAEMILTTNFLLLGAAIVASALALAPAPRPRLETPGLVGEQ